MALWSDINKAYSSEHGETRKSVFLLQFFGRVLPLILRCLRTSPKSSVNDKVADSSYTGDRNVKGLDQGLRIVDRKALSADIPHWATWFFAAGNVFALVGLIAICITQNNHFLLVIAAGLIAAAIGLREAEQAISDAQ